MASVERLHRLLQLVGVLQSGPTYNTLQLARECGVSRRTVFRDIRTLQESGIPIVYDKRRQGYALNKSVYLPPTDLTLQESLAVAVLCNELGDGAHGIPYQGAAQSAGHKILSALPGRLRELVGEISENIDLRVQPSLPHDGSDLYALLGESIAKRRQVRIQYGSLMPGEPDQFSTLLSPYRLLFKRRAWYIIGRSSYHRSVRTFHLARIHAAEQVDSKYSIPERFSLDRHLGNAWSLIRDRGQRHEVVVRFQPMVARNVAEVQWHKNQRLVWNDDGTLDFHSVVDGLREIQWWILGYGDQAEVLKPRELRQAMMYRIKAMQSIYDRDRPTKRSGKRRAKANRRKTTPRKKS